LFWLAVMLSAGANGRQVVGAEIPKPGSGVLKYEEPKYLTGAIYAPDAKRLLFKFKPVASRSGSTLKVQREFTYPDGKPAARERVVYEGNRLVLYELHELQIGAAGSARIRRAADNPPGSTVEFEYTKAPGSRPKASAEAARDNTLIADMVAPFLVSHWDALLRGEKVKCRYIVVPRRETVGFTFVKDSESTWQGRDVVIVRMEATSPFVATLVDPLFFTMEKAPPHHTLQYVGRATPKVLAGGGWKDLDAVMAFDWESAH
jgi:hypothetical protein